MSGSTSSFLAFRADGFADGTEADVRPDNGTLVYSNAAGFAYNNSTTELLRATLPVEMDPPTDQSMIRLRPPGLMNAPRKKRGGPEPPPFAPEERLGWEPTPVRLQRAGERETEVCDCGKAPGTQEHLWFDCRRLRGERTGFPI